MFDQEVEFGEHALLGRISTTLDMSNEESIKLINTHGINSCGNSENTNSQNDAEVTRTLREIVTPLFMNLVEEINRVLIYTAAQTRGEPVSLIYLVGGIARWKGADELLHSILNIDVETIPNPLTPFLGGNEKVDARSEQGSPELAIATGLALRGVISE